MKAISIVASTVSIASAGIPSDTICQSACGLVASSRDCRLSVPEGRFCSNLETMAPGNFTFTQALIAPENRLTIEEASLSVIAPDNNCFAMYYDVPAMRSSASYCAENNVCPNLFWDMIVDGVAPQYKLASPETEYNTASAVLCDYEEAEKPHLLEDHRGQIDPCKALCRLRFSRAECELVQREAAQCIRLFWTDAGKTATAFSVRAAVDTQIQVTVTEARAKLLAPQNNCEELCRRNPACAASQNKSNCRQDNRTCQDLVFRRTNDLSATPAVCFVGEAGCTNSDSPVLCQLPEDLARPVAAQPAVAGQPRADAAVDAATTTPSGVASLSGVVMIAAVTILVSMM